MLKGIPAILSPELLKILMEMGHADTLVIGDGNFPAASIAKNSLLVRLDGHGVPEILDAILSLYPLDPYVETPVSLMEVVPGDPVETPIWDEYKTIVARHDERGADAVGTIERFAFYEEAQKCYAVIATGDGIRTALSRTGRRIAVEVSLVSADERRDSRRKTPIEGHGVSAVCSIVSFHKHFS